MATKKSARVSAKNSRKGKNVLFAKSASNLSFRTLFLFALVFAGIGGYLLWQSFAAVTTTLDYRSLNADLSKGESRAPTLANEKGKRNVYVYTTVAYTDSAGAFVVGRNVYSTALPSGNSLATGKYRACIVGTAHIGSYENKNYTEIPKGTFSAKYNVDGSPLPNSAGTGQASVNYHASPTKYTTIGCITLQHTDSAKPVLFIATNPTPNAALRTSIVTLERLGNIDTNPDPNPDPDPDSEEPPAPSSDRPLGNISGVGSLVFRDEFNDTVVDPNVWSRSWFGTTNGYSRPINGNESGCYHVDQATESGGVLHLKTASTSSPDCRDRSGRVSTIRSGIVSSNNKKSFRYGYFEARITLDGPYNWPAWWTNGYHNAWPDRGELDIIELLSSRVQCAHVHFTNYEPRGDCASSFLSGTHTYGMKWTPSTVEFYYDGVKVGVTHNVSIPYDHYLVLNHGVRRDYSNGERLGVDMQVDYVRVWALQ